MNNTEIELKLLVKKASLKKLLASQLIKDSLDAESVKTFDLETIYYDTADLALKMQGIAYRVRNKGNGSYEATVKTAQKSSSGLSERVEINLPLADSNAVLEGFKDLGLGFELTDIIGDKKIEALFTTKIQRTVYVLSYGKSKVEMAVDKGKILRQDKAEPIDELELELLEGSKADLLALAAKMAEIIPLYTERRSKFARGLELMGIQADYNTAVFKMDEAGLLKQELLNALQVHADNLLNLQNKLLNTTADKKILKEVQKELLYIRSYLEFSQVFQEQTTVLIEKINSWLKNLRTIGLLWKLEKLWQQIYQRSSLLFEKSVLLDKLAEVEKHIADELNESLQKGELTFICFAAINAFCQEQWINEEYLVVKSTVACRLQEWDIALAEKDCTKKAYILENMQYILKSIDGKAYAKQAAKLKNKARKLTYNKEQDIYDVIRQLGAGSNSRVLSRDIGILYGWLLAKDNL